MKYVYSIEVNEFELEIKRNGRRIWGMRIPNLADTIQDERNGTLYSEWISHLDEKSWTNSDMLYEIAKHIQELHPNNKIDWYSTFLSVERGEYVDRALEIKRSIENTGESSMHSKLMERVRFGQESHNEEETSQIHEILISRLKQYGLPFDTN